MNQPKFYVCSVLTPDESYEDANLESCLEEKIFFVHKDTPQIGNAEDGNLILLTKGIINNNQTKNSEMKDDYHIVGNHKK